MNFDIFNKNYNYIGLHLNAHALKVIELESRRYESSVKAYVNAPLSKGLIAGDVFTNHDDMAKFIIKHLENPTYGQFTTKRCIISVPESKSFVRVINMKKLSEAQMENALMFEAEAYIPLPIDQVYYDWQIIEDQGDMVNVLLTASPKDYVESFIDIIDKTGLKVCGIEVEAQSVSRAIVAPNSAESILIADMDAIKTSLIMIESGVMQFTSSVPIAGDVFTDRLSKGLALPLAQAEDIKRQSGLINSVQYPNLKTYLLPAVEDLASEIKNILKFHYDHSEEKISKLVLAGGAAKLKGLAESLKPLIESFGKIEVIVADPWLNAGKIKNQPLGPNEGLSFTTAIGLSLWRQQQ